MENTFEQQPRNKTEEQIESLKKSGFNPPPAVEAAIELGGVVTSITVKGEDGKETIFKKVVDEEGNEKYIPQTQEEENK
jgi:hypothetical protein